MKMRNIIAGIMAAAVVGASVPAVSISGNNKNTAFAAETTGVYNDTIGYRICNDAGTYAVITSVAPELEGELELPLLLEGAPVEIIGEGALRNCNKLTRVVIPASVYAIEGFAFEGCTALKTVNLPLGLSEIGTAAFSGCKKLDNITVPVYTSRIGEDAFYGTAWYDKQPAGLIVINDIAYRYKPDTVPDDKFSLELEKGIKTIANGAFAGCAGLTDITIPDTVTTIGDLAFDGCSMLYHVELPSSVYFISVGAFNDCTSLTEIVIENPGCKIMVGGEMSSVVTIPKETTILGYDYSSAKVHADLSGNPFRSMGASPRYYGDVDGDGKITASDASQVLTEYADMNSGKKEFTDDLFWLADVDRNGKLGADDASLILTYYSANSGTEKLPGILEWIDSLSK